MVSILRPIYLSKNPIYVSVDYPLNADTFGDVFNSIIDDSKFRTSNFTQQELDQIKSWYDTHKPQFDGNVEKYKILMDKLETTEAKYQAESDPTKKAALQSTIEKINSMRAKMREVLEPMAEQMKSVQATLESKRKNRPRHYLMNLPQNGTTILKRRKDGKYELVFTPYG